MRPAQTTFASVVFLLAVHGSASGAGEDAASALAGLQDWLDGTRDLAGRFEQSVSSGALGAGTVESGRLYLRRPGRMRWDYLEPEKKVALIDGVETRLYVAEDRQLWEGRLDPGESLLPRLLTGDRPLAAMFGAEIADGVAAARTVRLKLVPREADEAFEEVVLVLKVPDYEIAGAEVRDAAGNRMTYRFTRLRRNRGLDEATFHFEPPPGTEIVRK